MIPTVSLVITVYNRERYLAAAIESVLKQTYTDFELLIWDDGSIDGSVEIASGYAQQDKRVRVVAASHHGRGQALKEAIANTKGKYLGWVDSDDLLHPQALAETVAALNHQSKIGMVYTDYLVIDERGRVKGLGSRCQIPYSPERLLIDFMTFHFRLIRRSAYDSVGGVNALFSTIEDYELCLRLSEATQVQSLKKPLYLYRVHPDNICSTQQVEQMELTKTAIAQALQRRGLADDLELEVQIRPKFTLHRKKKADSLQGSAAGRSGDSSRQPQTMKNCPSFPLLTVSSRKGNEPAQLQPSQSLPNSSKFFEPDARILAIVPHYRCEQWLSRCLSSLVSQTRPLDGIVVVDDGSGSPPISIVQQFPQVTLLETETNVGPYRIIQQVIEDTDYDGYLFQDADDWSSPERLEKLLSAVAKTGAELVGCREVRTYEQYAQFTPIDYYPEDVNAAYAQTPDYYLLHPSSLVSRNLVMRIGGYASGLRFGGDAEFLSRAVLNAKVINIPDFCYWRQIRGDSLTTSAQTGLASPARKVLQQKIAARAKSNFMTVQMGKEPDLTPLCQSHSVHLQECLRSQHSPLQKY